jgi:predicted flap endonuclease-1-like 5' DNA nuclease
MANKGKLVRVEIAPGRFVKMYEADAKQVQSKMQPQVQNKMVVPTQNKSVSLPVEELSMEIDEIEEEGFEDVQEDVEEFTAIPGIGEAAAKKIIEQGIRNIIQLEQSNWNFLPKNARKALEEYFNG